MLPVIRLWHSIGFGLIVEFPSGVAYSNQTCGTACLQPELEGVFIPLHNDLALSPVELLSPEIALEEYFARAYRGTGAEHGLDWKDADRIDEILDRHGLASVLRVDRTRLAESHEAWVRVLVLGEEKREVASRIFHGLGPYPRKAVITWTNSD